MNHLAKFPEDLDKGAVYGYAADCLAALWLRCKSGSVASLHETFSGFVRVPLADAAFFETWCDSVVEQQLEAATSGNRSRASFLSKKKTKVPHAFLEQFFSRQASFGRGAQLHWRAGSQGGGCSAGLF